jgi:GT2 family glycosyltransferase
VTDPPRVSVIIPAYNSEATIAATLDALRQQTFTDFETIVVDSSPGEATARLMGDHFPDVTFDHARERLLPHAARNRGVDLARGELLVFTDPDCVARQDWLARLVAAHDQGHAVVGGAIEVDGGWVERGIHLSKFSAWTGGGPPGPRDDLATANVLWSRSLMGDVGPFATDEWSGDTELSWRARAEGIELRFEPRALVSHTHESSLRAAWRERYVRGEDFARMRVRVERWSRPRAALHLLAVPLVPALLMARGLGRARRAGDLRRAILTAPIQLFAYVGWSLGESRAFARAALR